MTEHVSFDFRSLSARERYKLMIGTVVPRPIALVTTVDLEGRVNAAPFSFFNCLSSDPPILALGVENHPDMSFKDTALNVRLTEVFTVNIVSHAIAEVMHTCAIGFPPGVDELTAAGLTAMPGVTVASPWSCRGACRFRMPPLRHGGGWAVSADHPGRILFAHYQDTVIDPANLHVDPARLDAIARLGGSTCSTIRDRFEMPTLSMAAWTAANQN